MVFFSKALEGRAEKGDVGLWKFIVPQDSGTGMAAGLAREQKLCSPEFSTTLKFIFTPHHCCRTRGTVPQDLGGDEAENLNHGWEQRLQSALITQGISSFPPLQANNSHRAAPNLVRISGKFTTPASWMLSKTRRLQAVKRCFN